jgi:hypothetical protein
MANRGKERLANGKRSPSPRLEFLFESNSLVSDPLEFGSIAAGRRLVIPVEVGARIEGPLLHGHVLPGSMIVQLLRPDGVAEMEGNILLAMDDGHRILARVFGLLSLSPEAATELAEGINYDPESLYICSTVLITAAQDSPYAWLNQHLHMIKAVRTADRVLWTAWSIL